MYESNLPFSRIQQSTDESGQCTAGWLIERIGTEAARLGCDPPRYLQIGTGQWCAAEYATLFPLQSTAAVYAKEFGYEIGHQVRVIWHRKKPGGCR